MNATPARMSLILLMACSACERSRGGHNDKSKSTAPPAIAPSLAVSATATWGHAGAANASVAAGQGAAGQGAAGQGAAGQGAAGSASLSSGEPHCKALGKRALVSVGILRDRLIDMVVDGTAIYALSYHEGLIRATLTRFPRDGAPPTVIGRHSARGEPWGVILSPDSAYFTRNRTVYRMSRDKGQTVELAKNFSRAIAVSAGYVYGVTCDPKAAKDQLVRVAIQGGPVEAMVDIDRVRREDQDGGTFPCDYRSLVAEGSTVYVSHWNGRRIMRLSVESQEVSTLVTKKAFPSSLHLEGDQLYFGASDGTYRVSKQQGDPVLVTELGGAPFPYVVYAKQGMFIHATAPYATEESTYLLPWTGGKPKQIEYWKALDPNESPPDVGIRGLAVDDECVYTARQLENYLVIHGRSHR